MRQVQAEMRVALLSTAGKASRGSMRAYADTLQEALSRHAPRVRIELVELVARTGGGPIRRRIGDLSLPWAAWRTRHRHPDIWHVLDGSRAYCAGLAGFAPLVVTVHDIIPWLQDTGRFPQVGRLGHAARALWRANGWAYQRADVLACVSASTARDVLESWPVISTRCRVLPLPLRPEISQRSRLRSDVEREDGVVLHVGNSGFYKNRDGVLRIFARCDATIAKKLMMAGPAPTRTLRSLAAELGIAERIDWVCDPDDDQLSKLYQRASVLLFPSHYEGFGWPPLEAMAFGLPVVASREGSLPEVVAGTTAKLPSTDEDGLAVELQQLLSRPDARAEAVRLGRQLARRMDEHQFAQGMLELYDLALASDPSLPGRGPFLNK